MNPERGSISRARWGVCGNLLLYRKGRCGEEAKMSSDFVCECNENDGPCAECQARAIGYKSYAELLATRPEGGFEF